MSTALTETGDMMVITCRVPCTDLERLSLTVVDHTVSVSGPGGFRHRLGLPPEADMDRLGVELYKGILELRAPPIDSPLRRSSATSQLSSGGLGRPVRPSERHHLKEVKEMLKVERAITINAPVKKVFGYVDDPSHLPEFWPSLFEVSDVKTLPGGGHRFMWFYNFAGRRAHGTTESTEYVPYERIVDMAKGDLESTITWSFFGENGTTNVKFEAEYEAPEKFFPSSEKEFITRRNEFEAETLLANLKAKLEV